MKKMFLRLRPFIGLVLCSGLFIIGNSLANLQMPALLADIVNNGVAMGDSDYVTHTGIRMLGVAFFAVRSALPTVLPGSPRDFLPGCGTNSFIRYSPSPKGKWTASAPRP